ncbi:MAG: hypothetical protein ABIQ10_09230, partial [Gemmatimonadaceae bacterium]
MHDSTQRHRLRQLSFAALALCLILALVAAGWMRYADDTTAFTLAGTLRGFASQSPIAQHRNATRRADWRVNGSEGGSHYSPLDEV